MAFKYLPNGDVEPGIHPMLWNEFVGFFGYTAQRLYLIEGLKIALNQLYTCGCSIVYIDGSFTTLKAVPGDWDGCFDPVGIDLNRLLAQYPVFFDLVHPRAKQKFTFRGEIFPCTAIADPTTGETFLQFFQKNKDTKSPKGIIQLTLKNYIR